MRIGSRRPKRNSRSGKCSSTILKTIMTTKNKKSANAEKPVWFITGWAGGSNELPPEPLDAAIIFATVGDLVPRALKAVRKGGRVVCAGIHMSDIPSFPYRLLWEERQLVSVANLTRPDGIEFLRLAPEMGIVTKTTSYPLRQANQALADLRAGRFEGAAVLGP